MANLFLWTVLITNLSDDKNTRITRKYIVTAIASDLAVGYAVKVHNSRVVHSNIINVHAHRNKTNVISAGKVG